MNLCPLKILDARLFCKIKTYSFLQYLAELIPSEASQYNIWISNNIATYHCRTDIFKCVSSKNGTNYIWIFRTLLAVPFRKCLLKKIRLLPNPTHHAFNHLGLKLPTRLKLGLSHLNEHGFIQNFKNYINPLCTCCPSSGINVIFLPSLSIL